MRGIEDIIRLSVIVVEGELSSELEIELVLESI